MAVTRRDVREAGEWADALDKITRDARELSHRSDANADTRTAAGDVTKKAAELHAAIGTLREKLDKESVSI